MIALDIFSDPVCPWCMIGKANLDRALTAIGDHPFAVAWHPFQLNPDLPPEGVDRRPYMLAKFGSATRLAEIEARVSEAARQAGLEVNLDRITRQPNTLDAHRLTHWAGLEGCQTSVVAALFHAFFRDGRDIGAPDVLADLAAGVGMGRDLVLRLLASDADRDDITARDADARAKGVRAVPTFLVARQHVVEGAQPADLWQRVAAEVAGPT